MGTRIIQGHAVLREGRMALRRWPAHLAASIDVADGDDAAEAHSYDILIDYLLGNNASQQPVALRAPVEQSQDDEWQLTEKAAPGDAVPASIRFDFPAGASIGHFPQPADPRMHLRTVAPSCSATTWFAGARSEERIAQHAALLRDFVAFKGLSVIASVNGPDFQTQQCGPLGAWTRLSVPVSDWRASKQLAVRRPAFRKLVSPKIRAPMMP